MFEGGEGRFVGEVVLAGLHDFATEWAARVENGGRADQLHGGVVENLVQGAGDLSLRVFFEVSGDLGGVEVVDPFEFCTGLQ